MLSSNINDCCVMILKGFLEATVFRGFFKTKGIKSSPLNITVADGSCSEMLLSFQIRKTKGKY